jgi:hypothetical protein
MPNGISLISSELRCEDLNARSNDGGCLCATWCSAATQRATPRKTAVSRLWPTLR